MGLKRPYVIVIGVAAVAAVAVACTTLPITLPFQAQPPAQGTAAAVPGKPGEVAKPGEAPKPGAAAKPGGGGGVPVVTAPATKGKIETTLTLAGSVTAAQQTNLVPKTAGRIEKIFFDVGDKVKSGQTLVQLDRGTLDAAVKQAEANLMSAQARLTTVLKGARSEDVEVARAQLNSARARLATMELGGRAEDVAVAAAASQSAAARLKQVQDGSRDSDIKVAEQTVQAAQAAFNRAVADYNKLRTPAPDELAVAKAAVDRTTAALGLAQSNYDKVGWRPDIAARAESVALQQATADYQSAVAQLRLRQQPREEDVAASQKAVDSARAQLDAMKARLDQLQGGATAEELTIATSTLIQAQQTLAKARQPFTEQDIEAQRQAVRQAEQTLSLRENPFTEADVQTARAQVAQAQAQVESAKTAALEGVIVAPYDGVITARPLAEGALTNANVTAIAISSNIVEIVLNVEESRIGRIKVGQPATLSLQAHREKLFPGKVVSIAPSADARTHTFPVKIRPEPAVPEMLPGMFAEVKVTVQSVDGVVIVPRDAVVQRVGKATVFVVGDGRARAIDVGAGLSDDSNWEVPAGINPGDQVIVAGQATVNDGENVRLVNAAGTAGAAAKPGTKPEGAGSDAAKPGAKPEGATGGAGQPPGKPEAGGAVATKPAGKPETPAKTGG
jgi:RND family efflux transporter MFP subunit